MASRASSIYSTNNDSTGSSRFSLASSAGSALTSAFTSSSSSNDGNPPTPAYATYNKRISTNPLAALTSSSSSSSASPATAIQIPQSISIYDRNLAKTRGSEVATAAWAFLFSEMVQYTQRRVDGIAEFEQRLSQIGYRVGQRLIELLPLRDSLPPSTSRNASAPPRHTRLLPVLHYVHTTLFKYLFNRPASSLEKSTEEEDEYMIGDDEPVLDRGVNVPREMSSLSTNALLAGLVEAVLDGLGFTSRVTSHLVPTDQHPRRTVLLIKLEKQVMEREKALASVK